VRLKGTVEVSRIYGPPNFGETPKVDQEYFIHRLYAQDTSYCFVVGSSGEAPSTELKSVDKVQLQYLSDALLQTKRTVESGLCYIAEGKVYPSLGEPMSREPALLEVSSLKRC